MIFNTLLHMYTFYQDFVQDAQPTSSAAGVAAGAAAAARVPLGGLTPLEWRAAA